MISWLKRKPKDPKAQLNDVLGRFELPTFSTVVLEGLRLLRNPDASFSQISAQISKDPKSTTRILAVSNSSAYALRRPVQNLDHAVALLGRAQVETLLLALATSDVLPRKKIPGYNPHTFWKEAAKRAAVAQEFARLLHPASRSEVFTAALLQEMAVPLLVQSRAEEYLPVLSEAEQAGANLNEIEAAAFGWDHAQVGGWMCEYWGFPEGLTNAIGAHHETGEDVPPAVALCALIETCEADGGNHERLYAAGKNYGLCSEEMSRVLSEGEVRANEIAAQFC